MSAPIVVAGLINIETTLRIDRFPVDYNPVRFPFHGIGTTVSGVGVNVAKALLALGMAPRLLSLVGGDELGALSSRALGEAGLGTEGVRRDLAATPQSVILYDGDGRRQINVDLKDIQERAYPAAEAAHALRGAAMACLCNINFARPMLAVAAGQGVPIATDVHAIGSLDDSYNRDFMAAADILFQSHEQLPCAPVEWARQVQARFGNRMICVGLGGDGALLLEAGHEPVHVAARAVRPVVSTIGAGDALFAAFVAGIVEGRPAPAALARAVTFAGWKIGAAGAADGFCTAGELDRLTG